MCQYLLILDHKAQIIINLYIYEDFPYPLFCAGTPDFLKLGIVYFQKHTFLLSIFFFRSVANQLVCIWSRIKVN